VRKDRQCSDIFISQYVSSSTETQLNYQESTTSNTAKENFKGISEELAVCLDLERNMGIYLVKEFFGKVNSKCKNRRKE
jgi:hypothetical protein